MDLELRLPLSYSELVRYTSIGIEVKPIVNAAFTSETVVDHIPLESPAKEGTYEVKTLTYGSGKDKHRDYFGEKVDIKNRLHQWSCFPR